MVVMAQVVIRDVVVERVSVDRFVEQPTGIRREGETLVIPVFEEVPVVVIKTKLKEEVRVTTRTTTQFRRTPVEIRRETVTIERIPALSGDRSPHLRRGRTRKLVNIGPPIIALATGDTRTTIPRTVLVSQLAGGYNRDSSDWTQLEPEARRSWEAEHQGNWEQMKDAVRDAWERAKSKDTTSKRRAA